MESLLSATSTVQLRVFDAYATVFPKLLWRTKMSDQHPSRDFEELMTRVKEERCRDS